MLVLLPFLFALNATPLEVRVGETLAIPGTKVSVTFVGVVDDSRCPKGVTCVWEGDATIEVRVTPERGDPETVQLHVNARTTKDVVVQGLHLTLERLEPYPEDGRPINRGDYRATLAITHE